MPARRRSRFTYANVMATIAVFLALGGSSYAALSLPRNSVGTRQLRNGAVTTAKIRRGAITASKLNVAGLAVQHASSADSATSARTAASAVNATNATNATNAVKAATATDATLLDGQAPSAFQAKAEWALVSANGTVMEQSGGLSASETSPGAGTYLVMFPDAVGAKLLSVSLSDVGGAPGGPAVTSPCAGSGQAPAGVCGSQQGNADAAFVETTDPTDNTLPAEHAFYIQALP